MIYSFSVFVLDCLHILLLLGTQRIPTNHHDLAISVLAVLGNFSSGPGMMLSGSQGHRLHLFMSEGAGWQSPGHKTKVYGSKMAELRTASAAWRVGAICYQQQIANTRVVGEDGPSIWMLSLDFC